MAGGWWVNRAGQLRGWPAGLRLFRADLITEQPGYCSVPWKDREARRANGHVDSLTSSLHTCLFRQRILLGLTWANKERATMVHLCQESKSTSASVVDAFDVKDIINGNEVPWPITPDWLRDSTLETGAGAHGQNMLWSDCLDVNLISVPIHCHTFGSFATIRHCRAQFL